ncbi:MAG: hypothetical protein PWP24_724 [Clostridiales bacterium]|nr:hypothetical protein [Clostridiales bacterium]
MLSTVNTIPLNDEGKEIVKRGREGFPCNAYVGEVQQFIGGKILPHWHNEFEMFILEEGIVQVMFSDSSYILQAGEGYFVNSDVLHGIICNTDMPCRYRSIVFDPFIISGYKESVFEEKYIKPFVNGGAPFWIFHLSDVDRLTLVSFFDTAYYACETETYGYEFTVRDALSKTVMQLNGYPKESLIRVETMREQRLKCMLQWIDKHYMEQITAADIANSAGICLRECQRTFATVIKDTPIKYLLRKRIMEAANLLLSSSTSIVDVCERCGFENQSYFSKQFRLFMGVAPREYQKNGKR